jgi:hypothetical protein
MKTHRKKTVVQEDLVSTTCDLCGAVKDDNTPWPEPDRQENLPNGDGLSDLVNSDGALSARWSRSCFDTGEVRHVTLDLCPRCVVDRVIPWLHEQGANIPEVERYEW